MIIYREAHPPHSVEALMYPEYNPSNPQPTSAGLNYGVIMNKASLFYRQIRVDPTWASLHTYHSDTSRVISCAI